VCPALNNLESTVPKWPPTKAQLPTSHESLQLLVEKEQKKEAETLEKNERAAKKKEREELLQKKKTGLGKSKEGRREGQNIKKVRY